MWGLLPVLSVCLSVCLLSLSRGGWCVLVAADNVFVQDHLQKNEQQYTTDLGYQP